MVKVVGHDDNVLKKCSCKGCGAVLLYGTVDVKQGKSYDYTGSCDRYDFIVCPECNSEVIVGNW